jgi:hypothetical protein
MFPFLLVIQHLHDVVSRAKGMCLVMEVLCEVRNASVVVEGISVFVVTSVKSSSNLTYIGFVAIWAS